MVPYIYVVVYQSFEDQEYGPLLRCADTVVVVPAHPDEDVEEDNAQDAGENSGLRDRLCAEAEARGWRAPVFETDHLIAITLGRHQ